MSDIKLRYQLSKAYLQWARSILKTQIVCHPPEGCDFKFPPNLLFALTSHVYIFSYLAIVAFVNGQLGQQWKNKNKYLRNKFHQTSRISDLLRTDLGQLKDGLKELCLALNIRRIDKARPELWNDLLNVMKNARDFLVHPKPDPDEFQRIIMQMTEKKNWNFPIKTASGVISYFYEQSLGKTPTWLQNNEEYAITRIDATFTNIQ